MPHRHETFDQVRAAPELVKQGSRDWLLLAGWGALMGAGWVFFNGPIPGCSWAGPGAGGSSA